MRVVLAAALGLGVGLSVVPASAQNLNDIGRVLQDQVLGNRSNPDREREAYEAGRRDQERARYEDARRRDDFRRDQEARRDDDRHRYEDAQRHERDIQRQRADQERAWADERRARDQSYRR